MGQPALEGCPHDGSTAAVLGVVNSQDAPSPLFGATAEIGRNGTDQTWRCGGTATPAVDRPARDWIPTRLLGARSNRPLLHHCQTQRLQVTSRPSDRSANWPGRRINVAMVIDGPQHAAGIRHWCPGNKFEIAAIIACKPALTRRYHL